MKKINDDQICEEFIQYIHKNFKTQKNAAIYYKCSAPFISGICNKKERPNQQMLNDMGYIKKIYYESILEK